MSHSHFIAFDFGICINEEGEYEPQLIEMQGFPTLFAYEVVIDDIFRKHFDVPEITLLILEIMTRNHT